MSVPNEPSASTVGLNTETFLLPDEISATLFKLEEEEKCMKFRLNEIREQKRKILDSLPGARSARETNAPHRLSSSEPSIRNNTRKQEAGYKEGRALTAKEIMYCTSHYKLFDPTRHSPAILAMIAPRQQLTPILDYSIFDQYLLYSNPYLTQDTVNEIPRSGVRLDDMAVGHVLASPVWRKDLNTLWPAEFDVPGFPRATRAPLGHAYKIKVEEGDTDVSGYVATAVDVGFYIGWWRGLQPLMGKEGLDAGTYIVRPPREKFACEGFGWKKDWKCKVQQPAGSAHDPTPGLLLRGNQNSAQFVPTTLDTAME